MYTVSVLYIYRTSVGPVTTLTTRLNQNRKLQHDTTNTAYHVDTGNCGTISVFL